MWNDIKQNQLDELRRREAVSALNDEERGTLEQLLHELEQEEWQALRPALDRMRDEQMELERECSNVQAQTAALAAIAERQTDLLARARSQLNAFLNEQTLLNSEVERALGRE